MPDRSWIISMSTKHSSALALIGNIAVGSKSVLAVARGSSYNFKPTQDEGGSAV